MEGTDLWLEGYRMDISFNQDKDNVQYISQEYTISTGYTGQLIDVQFGIRHRNKKSIFEEPVLVLMIKALDEKFFFGELDICAKAVAENAPFMDAFERYESIVFE